MTAAKDFAKALATKNLQRIYAEKIRHSKAIGLDRMRPELLAATLSAEIATIRKKATLGSYRFTPYKEKLVSKGADSAPRVLSIPTARDRLVLRALCEFLQKVFPSAISALPQTKIESLKTALATGKYAEYVKIDLRNFYPSLPHALLLKALKSKIRKPQILALIRAALTAPTVPESKGGAGASPSAEGVPQGLAVSNLLAEIALAGIDATYAARPDLWYSRYVDDILILGPAGSASKVAAELTDQLKAIGLTPHELGSPGSKSKIGSTADQIVFLGYQVDDGKLSVRPETARKFESSIASIFTAYRHKLLQAKSPADKTAAVELCKWRLNLRITGCIFNGRRLGWAFYFSQITDTSRLRALNSTVDTLLKRFSLKGVFRPKSLVKVHYECRRKNKTTHQYIPNFDTMGIIEKRRVLGLFLGASKVALLTDARVDQLFKMRISLAVKELEEDLAGIS